MKPIILAVTGASAQPLAERAIKLLLSNDYSIKVILSRGAYEVWNAEVGIKVPIDPKSQEDFWRQRLKEEKGNIICHRWNDNSADIASGSYQTRAMIIVPCTMGTIGRIACGLSNNLIERCADVHLKEGRKIVLAPRESPFNLIHIDNMKKLIKAGAIIAPPMPAWYTQPNTIEEMIDFIVIRLFDTLGDDLAPLKRWEGKKR